MSSPAAPAPRPSDRAACIHCREDVCAAEDVAAIREHSMTCSASPVVQELRRLRELLHERERTVEVSSRLLVDQRDAARGELAERSPTRPSRLLSNEEKRVVVDALHAAAAYARRTRSHALDGKTFVVDSDLSEHVDALARRAGTCDRLAAELHGYEVRLEKAPS